MDEEDNSGQCKEKALDVWQKRSHFMNKKHLFVGFDSYDLFLVSTSAQQESYPRMPDTLLLAIQYKLNFDFLRISGK